jgi:hypothetical protein
MAIYHWEADRQIFERLLDHTARMETQRATRRGIAETDVGVLGSSVRPPSTDCTSLNVLYRCVGLKEIVLLYNGVYKLRFLSVLVRLMPIQQDHVQA